MTKSELFKKAHAMAKATVEEVGNYMVAFKLALKMVYASQRCVYDRIAVAKQFKFDVVKMLKGSFKVWSKGSMERIYLNDKVFEFFGLDYSKFANKADQRRVFGQGGVDKVYFDCKTQEFCGINLNAISDYK